MSRVFFLKSKSFGVKARNYPKRIIDRYELFLENESVKSMIIEYVVSDFYIFLILFISHEFYLPELLERNIDDMKAFWYVSDGNEKTTKKIFSNLFRMIYTENKSDVQIEVEVNLMYDRLEKMVKKKQKRKICQINIDVKFGSYDTKEERDTSKRHILNPVGRKGSQNLLLGTVYSKNKMKEKSSEFALKERLLIQYADKYYPVKKYAVDLSELMEKKKIEYLSPDKKWFLFLQGVYRDHIERMAQIESFALTQEFCLILTIRDPNQKEHVYDEVTQKLDEYNFWHSNIRVATDVNIPL